MKTRGIIGVIAGLAMTGVLILIALGVFFGDNESANKASSNTPVQVTWPTGWQLSNLPAPADLSGKETQGTRLRAVKNNDDGKPLAAIELTYIARKNNDATDLSAEFTRMKDTVNKLYTEAGLSVAFGTTRQGQLGQLTTQETLVDVKKSAEVVLQQSLLMARGDGYFYSLSYSAPMAVYQTYLPIFEQVRASITLE